MVSRLESGHVTSDGFDNASNFMPENRGSGERKIAVQIVEVTMADAGSNHTDEHFVVSRKVDGHVLDAHAGPRFEQDCCFHHLS
jgi:hypothetical protein